jgi:hypothetical protein
VPQKPSPTHRKKKIPPPSTQRQKKTPNQKKLMPLCNAAFNYNIQNVEKFLLQKRNIHQKYCLHLQLIVEKPLLNENE